MAETGIDPIQAATEADSVRKVTPADHDAVVHVLADAFYDDPVLSWFFPDDSHRRERLRGLFRFAGRRMWFDHDVTYTTGGVVGAAIWVPPGEWLVSIPEQIRMTPAMARAVGLRDLPRVVRGFNLMETEHPKEPLHFYLPVIGVHPDWQGKGIGSALLGPMLERCDREGVPAYLEATSERSRAAYERHGFVASEPFVFPNGPPMWPMLREPSH